MNIRYELIIITIIIMKNDYNNNQETIVKKHLVRCTYVGQTNSKIITIES